MLLPLTIEFIGSVEVETIIMIISRCSYEFEIGRLWSELRQAEISIRGCVCYHSMLVSFSCSGQRSLRKVPAQIVDQVVNAFMSDTQPTPSVRYNQSAKAMHASMYQQVKQLRRQRWTITHNSSSPSTSMPPAAAA